MTRYALGKATYSISNFRCLSCGNRSIPIPRPLSETREKGHIKDLWCTQCKDITKNLEIRHLDHDGEFALVVK